MCALSVLFKRTGHRLRGEGASEFLWQLKEICVTSRFQFYNFLWEKFS